MTDDRQPPKPSSDGDSLRNQIEALPRSMPITAKPGQLIRFTGIGGSQIDIDDAATILDLGQVYVVLSVEIGRGQSAVVLHEGRFNTAMFELA